MIMVKSSNRPNNIRNANIHLPLEGIAEKLKEGPTSPIPGPTFPKDVATEPIAVNNGCSKSFKIMAIANEPTTNKKR